MRIRTAPSSCIKRLVHRSNRRGRFINVWVPSVAVVKHKETRTALLWVVMQRVLAISYRRFGTTYQAHLQGSRILGFFLNSLHLKMAVAQWLRCCATNRKVAVSIPAGVSGFFIDIKSFRSHYSPGVESASNRNEYQEYFLGVKAAGA